MGIALFSISRLLAPFSRGFAPRRSPAECAHHGGGRPPFGTATTPACQASGGAPKHNAAAAARMPARPLRVTRVLDQGHHRGQAGRMVISGNMSDVCAELDRLSRIEAS